MHSTYPSSEFIFAEPVDIFDQKTKHWGCSCRGGAGDHHGKYMSIDE
jgi:hypothetical protein